METVADAMARHDERLRQLMHELAQVRVQRDAMRAWIAARHEVPCGFYCNQGCDCSIREVLARLDATGQA